MSANSNNQSDMNNNEGQVVAMDQSSALQIGTSLAIGGLQEQIESGDYIQQVDSSDDMDEDEQEVKYSSLDSGESFTIEVRDVPKVLHTPATSAAELTERIKGEVHHVAV